jgi:aspartate/methionine/tyrosine aminotransferase
MRRSSNLFISAGAFVQRAGIAALQQSWPDVQRMVEMYNQRRRVILAGLRDIGFGVPYDPTGAFYVFADATRFGRDSYALAFDILERAKVAVAPGIDFDSTAKVICALREFAGKYSRRSAPIEAVSGTWHRPFVGHTAVLFCVDRVFDRL